jgi:site-specific DNA-methyltransferase (adenine-specific)
MAELDVKGLLEFPRKAGGRIQLRRYLDERAGMPVTSIWDDIRPINAMAQERLGYPTQKPVALLERIIRASSIEGDLVLDPFCGCGTTIHAAQKLGRAWIGIDITHLAISLIERRLKDAFPGVAFEVHGTPKDLESAIDLARRDKYQFQWWAVSMVEARPFGGKKKGADSGIDGILFFRSDKDKTEKVLVSVKGGENVGVGMVRDLIAVVEREKAAVGVLISLALPTRAMEREAAAAGFFESPFESVPKIQIITLAELFQGIRPRIPRIDAAATFRAAARERQETQPRLI